MEDQSQSEEGDPLVPPVESAINLEIENDMQPNKETQQPYYFENVQYMDESAIEDAEINEPHLKKKKIIRKGGSKTRKREQKE